MIQLKNIFAGILFILFLAFPLNIVLAQTDNEHDLTQDEITILNTDRKLVADKADTKIETAIIESIRMQFELETEEEEFSPADELYDGIWNNNYVRAYAGVSIPDTYPIDISSFIMPVEGRITSSYGTRRRRFHYGTDLKLQTGDTVFSAFKGKVRVAQYERKGYGYYLVLRHPNGLETVYGHLSRFLVGIEETVEAGQAIALGGNTGRSTGPHLHFECRFLGHAINPADMFDFDNSCTYDEAYVFEKSKLSKASSNKKYVPSNKYTTPNKKQTKQTKQVNQVNQANQGITYHRIRSGDTLSRIAQQYRVSINQLCRLNGLQPTTTLKIGKVIRCS